MRTKFDLIILFAISILLISSCQKDETSTDFLLKEDWILTSFKSDGDEIIGISTSSVYESDSNGNLTEIGTETSEINGIISFKENNDLNLSFIINASSPLGSLDTTFNVLGNYSFLEDDILILNLESSDFLGSSASINGTILFISNQYLDYEGSLNSPATSPADIIIKATR